MKFEGIVDCTNDEYHGEKEHLSSSNLKLLLKDPKLFYDEKILGNRKEVSPSTQAIFDDGTLAHTMILEPHMFDKEFKVYPGFSKRGKAWEEFKNDPANEGFILLSQSQKAKVESWVKSYKELKVATSLVSGGEPEKSLFTKFLGVPLKVRADYINIEEGYIVDVKTTSGPTDVDGFKYTIESFQYDLSAAMYSMLFEKFYGKPFKFYFLILGKRDKSCEVYELSDETREVGKQKVLNALDVFKKCKETDIWSFTNKKLNDKVSKDDYEILKV